MISASVYSHFSAKEILAIGNFFNIYFNEKQKKIWSVVSNCFITSLEKNFDEKLRADLDYIQNLLNSKKLPISTYHIDQNEIIASIYWRFGEIYLKIDAKKSVDFYLKAIEKLPEQIDLKNAALEAIYYAATKYYREGKEHIAIEYYLKSTNINPNNSSAYFRIGRAYTNLGDIDKGIESLEKSLMIDSSNTEALRGLAAIHRYMDFDKAYRYAKKATLLNTEDEDSFNYLGLLCRDKLRIDEAIKAHEKALNITINPVTYFFLSLLYAYKKNEEYALKLIDEANILLEDEHYTTSIRPIWSIVIRWAKLIFNDKTQEAEKFAEDMVQYITTHRTLKAVKSHIDFLLLAIGKNDLISTYEQILRINL